ncbi:MAG: response regulator [candidate division WOR-3 bacterium]|nr:response regulator [candidate division WOR-3 bacterium]
MFFKKTPLYNIILAEDNPDHQKLIKAIFHKYNVNIDIANNGKELLEMLPLKPYDLVLMDIQMPVMDGYTATEKIRQKPQYQDLIIIGLTAYSLPGDAQIAISKGMNDYITKPIDKEELIMTVRRYLNIKK